MGWKRIKSPETRLATKGLVDEFCDMEKAPHDRPLSERRMTVYARILAAGEFRPVTWASVACTETNGIYRVNGKHTSLLLRRTREAGKPLPELFVTVERYQCDKLTDVASLYNTFDSNLAQRTGRDINLAFAASVPGLTDVPDKYIHATISAAAFHHDDKNGQGLTSAEKAELLLDHVGFAKWLTDTIQLDNSRGINNTRHLLRQASINAMMSTYNRGPNKARDFWTSVKKEDNPDPQHPTRVLARYLVRVVSAGSNSRSGAGKVIAGMREQYVKCLHAWNAWRKGEKTALNYHAKAPIPEVAK